MSEFNAGTGPSPSLAPPPPLEDEHTWWRALEPGQLGEGRVTTVTLGHRTLAITRSNGSYGALDNRCPHQGGPLGEGLIERGWLRCPWHGYDYSPCNGVPPPPFTDRPASYPIEERADGVWVALPDERPRTRTVADVVVETMVAWGINAVFGMVGHSNLGLADALRKVEERGALRYIGIRHEGAAAFAASAYGKLTGRPAACFGIAGPGSTNLLTGLYDAKADRAPVLALSGQVPSKVLGRGAFQDVDLNGAFSDVARYSKTVQADSDHAELVSLACKTAIVERDVAHLVFPDEIQNLPAGDDQAAGTPDGRMGDLRIAPPDDALDAALAAIAAARRPLIIVGAGAHDAIAHVMALADRLGSPVMTTFKAKGLVSDRHPLGCGVLGRSGTPVASWFMNESDLVIAFGASFSNHTGIADYKPIVQVDRDPMALGRFHAVTVPVLGDVGVTARALVAGLPDVAEPNDLRAEVAQRRALWQREKRRRQADDRGRGLSSAAIFATLTATVPDDAVICVDVGNNAYSFGRYFESSGSQDVLMSGYLGSIGFALPAAMGAWAATGGTRKVVGISGDGGFGQYAMELTTLAKYDMPITHVLLDNGELGKISKEQRAGEWDVWQTSLRNPDFAAFAELCGVRGFGVGRRAELEPAMRDALAHPGPSLVHIANDPQLV
jgi:thiamine pyrophosphate-dependent acetolactate synthase large subunit-like protein/nitrite reductase/ring-hydroxylating ferredoxin subunit